MHSALAGVMLRPSLPMRSQKLSAEKCRFMGGITLGMKKRGGAELVKKRNRHAKWVASERVRLAQRAIDQIEAGSLEAETSTYFKTDIVLAPGDNLATFVRDRSTTVCAVGALFVARLDKKRFPLTNNTIQDNYWVFGERIESYLHDLWSDKQLSLMISTFDCCGSGCNLTFGIRYSDPEERLLAMMRNIVRNGGLFKPELEGEQLLAMERPQLPAMQTAAVVEGQPSENAMGGSASLACP